MRSLMRTSGLFGLALATMFSVGVGCGGESTTLVPKRLDARATLQVAGLPVEVELALDHTEIRLGMMYRRELPEDQGMLFVFTSESDRSFYMKNVPITLDLCFLDSSGVLINIVLGQPHEVEPKLLSERPARFVLELAGGWAERHGLKPGDQIEISDEITAQAILP